MWNLFGGSKIIPEVLWAHRSKLPDELDVNIIESEDGGFVAVVKNVPGCMTQGDSIEELNQMINFAVYDYFSIPKEYFPHIHSYIPPRELMSAHGKELVAGKEMVFRTA